MAGQEIPSLKQKPSQPLNEPGATIGNPGPPIVSVVIPFYNAVSTLGQAIASVQAQTRPDWEALLVDDGSTDGSVDVAKRAVAMDPRLRLLHPPTRLGAAGARNLGIQSARGRYIGFLDADDLWLPQKLELQVPKLLAGAPIVFSSYRRIDLNGRPMSEVRARSRVRYRDALGGNPIGCLTGIWDRARFPQARMPDLPLCEDYAFWLSLLREGAEASGLPEVLAEYRVSPHSRSARKLRAARGTWQVLRQEFGLRSAAGGFALYAIRAMRQRL